MNWIEKMIGEFGRQIGINNLALNTSGRLQLAADDGFSIGMIKIDSLPLPELIIYISKPIQHLPEARIKSVLQLANLRKFHDWPLQVATHDGKIFLSNRIPDRSISLSVINESINFLRQFADRHL